MINELFLALVVSLTFTFFLLHAIQLVIMDIMNYLKVKISDFSVLVITLAEDIMADNRTAIIGAIQKSMSVTSDNCTIIP